ncbi:carbonic anhydrase [Achromobacter aloeverae]|uniref:carbonic anhydrase n=1 Tax=Achromobacter aloeverae TaxID=1750518 RepID=A0A4Q1HDQ6_9BURK|nr:carbonic anhydrase [Achromobacter aloeverae]RXN84436.1 carbonic anhydrase [Achromobacter aloeverae]
MPPTPRHTLSCNCTTTQTSCSNPGDAGHAARRRFMGLALAAAASGGLGLNAAPALGATPKLLSPLPANTPDEALAKLMAGNARYLQLKHTTSPHDFEMLRTQTAEGQSPFAAILACSDSRVPVELLFDQSIGKLFVVRVAGNVASSAVIGSLEYAAEVLKVKTLMVLGHSRCGAVKAAIDNRNAPGQITTLYSYMHGAIAKIPSKEYRAVVMQNAIEQARVLGAASPVIAQRVKTGALRVQPAIYDVETGEVALLGLA